MADESTPASNDSEKSASGAIEDIMNTLSNGAASAQMLAYSELSFALGLVMQNAASTQYGMKKLEAAALVIGLKALDNASK